MANETLREELEALPREALIERLVAMEEAHQTRSARQDGWRTLAADVSVKAMLGDRLYQATLKGWAAWERWATSPDRASWPSDETRDVAASLLARLTRVRVLYVVLSLIPTLLIIMQVWILVNQNRILERQNGLLAFEQTTNLRDKLFRWPLDVRNNRLTNYQEQPAAIDRWPLANASTRAALLRFATKQPSIAQDALYPLLSDEAGSVAAGALVVLYAFDPEVAAAAAELAHADLSQQQLPGLNAPGARLESALLIEANLTRANLTGADLTSADLGGADLSEATLREAVLGSAVLEGTRLTGADLQEANLSNADLVRANLGGANLSGATLRDLRNWQGIANIEGADVSNVRDAPLGFKAWALERGAIDRSN